MDSQLSRNTNTLPASDPPPSAFPSSRIARTAVFCTALIDADPLRYQSWIDYYTQFFAGEQVDLYLFNDGPVSTSLDWKGSRLVAFPEPLGRQDTWIFPGWKRSFSAAVRQLGAQYRFLGHVESDTVVLKRGRQEFLRALRSPGYRLGYTAYHGFADTSLQTLNSERARRFFCDRYAGPASFARQERFEKVVQYALHPRLMLHGERVEDREIDLHQRYTYLSQLPLHRFQALYPQGDVPPSSEPPITHWRRQARNEALHLYWTLRSLHNTE